MPLAPTIIEKQLPLPERIRQYSFVYPLVLEIGLIELQGGLMSQRMIRFMDWMHANWYMSAPATLLAKLCFSGSPPRGMLKRLRADDRNLALKGLRNCAWDLTYVTWWGERLKKQKSENRLYLFCTRDKALMNIAQKLLMDAYSGPQNSDQAIS